MNIDWGCEEAKGKDYCLYCDESNYIFCKQEPRNNGEYWLVGFKPFVIYYTLHERPKAEQMKETFYTKEMHETGELPKAGMKCSFFVGTKLGGGDFVEGTCLSVAKKSNGANVIMFEYTHNDSMPIDCTLFSNKWVKPIDKRTDKEKAIDDVCGVLLECRAHAYREIALALVDKIKDGKIHCITVTGDK